MKKILTAGTLFILGVAVLSSCGNKETTATKASPTWDKACSRCHNGNMAVPKDTILTKYKSKEEFLNAVQRFVSAGKMPPNLPYGQVANEFYGK